jgi:acetyl esterase/lipase
MKFALEILILFLASINLVLTRFALIRLHQPTTLFLWIIKVLVSALSPILFLVGILAAILGWLLSSWPIVVIGGLSALLYLNHIFKITRAPTYATDFEKTFQARIKKGKGRKPRFLSNRYSFLLPSSPEPILTQDIPFYTIQNSNRQLLCDLWQPQKNINHSGLAFIYLHGSAWSVLDKDYGTRTFFKRLTAQGHVVMDVAYRLFPEANFLEMVHDAKHAIAWMKYNATFYQVNPERIVIGGGSAGAHLSLLTAYTSDDEKFTPADLQNVDLSVCGVISLYGESDLTATYYHTAQHLVSTSALAQSKPTQTADEPSWIQKKIGKDFHRLGFDKGVQPGMLVPMLGGTPNEKPEAYALFSPITYIHSDCPPTLFIHGDHDILAPLYAIRQLQIRLTKVGVPVIMHVIRQTDHAFDLILPKISPSAQNALYDIERFLLLLLER